MMLKPSRAIFERDEMARKHTKGFTLTELLAVIAILGILVLISIPAMGEWIRRARVRAATDQLTVDLRAARYIAVTNRSSTNFNISIDPLNSYNYTDSNGKAIKIDLPVGVRLVSTTSTTIVFNQNGGVNGGSETIVMENQVAGDLVHRYTITVSTIGKISVQFESVST